MLILFCQISVTYQNLYFSGRLALHCCSVNTYLTIVIFCGLGSFGAGCQEKNLVPFSQPQSSMNMRTPITYTTTRRPRPRQGLLMIWTENFTNFMTFQLRKDPRSTLMVDFMKYDFFWSLKVNINIFLMRGKNILRVRHLIVNFLSFAKEHGKCKIWQWFYLWNA